jgi:hypothetical protein
MKPLFTFSHLLIALCSVTLLFATGCASTGNSTINQPFTAKLNQFKSATVEVKSTVANPPEKLDEFLEQLQIRTIVKLREAKAFEKIYSQAETDSHSDLRITVIITNVRDVDNFNRVMWGAFAGQAKTEATIEFNEQATGKLIGSGKIEGKSSNGTIFSGTTPEAVDRVADEVVKIVEENLY